MTASLQVFQPHKYSSSLYTLVACLEEEFGTLVGGSSYLTPVGSQALAPHYDDVEVFILQTEGSKSWKIWQRSCGSYYLPRVHSPDLPYPTEEASLEFTLQEGDFLYMPRGTIHVANTATTSSTHITLSTYQRHSYMDLFSSALPLIMKNAWHSNPSPFIKDIRSGLPLTGLNIVDKDKNIATYTKSLTEFLMKLLTDNSTKQLVNNGIESAMDLVQ